MKKIIMGFLLTIATAAFANTNVPIVWPFSPASNQATALRTIIQNANSEQNKYTFVFENKPGAGGSIAVNNIISDKSLKLGFLTTSAFIRPIFFPNESYDISDLRPVAVASVNSPLALISGKYKSLEDIKKAERVTVGMISGGFIELVAKKLQEVAPNIVLVPYQTTIAATQDAAGGHIDASLDFIKDALPWVESGKLNAIGVTGTRDIGAFKHFKQTGFDNLVTNYYIVTKKDTPDNVVREMNTIMNTALSNDNIKQVFANDYATIEIKGMLETVRFWEQQRKYWMGK